MVDSVKEVIEVLRNFDETKESFIFLTSPDELCTGDNIRRIGCSSKIWAIDALWAAIANSCDYDFDKIRGLSDASEIALGKRTEESVRSMFEGVFDNLFASVSCEEHEEQEEIQSDSPKYIVHLTDGTVLKCNSYDGQLSSDFSNSLTFGRIEMDIDQLLLYLTGRGEITPTTNGRVYQRKHLDEIKTIEVVGKHAPIDRELRVRFRVWSGGKVARKISYNHLKPDFYLGTRSHLSASEHLTLDDLFLYLTGQGSVDRREGYENVERIEIVTIPVAELDSGSSEVEEPEQGWESTPKYIVHVGDYVVWRTIINEFIVTEDDTFIVTDSYYYELTLAEVNEALRGGIEGITWIELVSTR